MTKVKKAVVYTAIAGYYDYLRPVPNDLKDIDFVCFTDGCISEKHCRRKGWIWKRVPKETGSSRKSCRFLKSMPEKFLDGYRVSIWIDSNISFTINIVELIDQFIYSEALIQGFRHPVRNCPYLEARECIEQGKDLKKNIKSMVDYMRNSGFPEGKGLTETNVLFRKHNVAKVQALNEDWSYFLSEFTIRDQISFDFLCWRHGIDILYFEGSTHRNQHSVFSRGLHRSGSRLKKFFSYIESFQGLYPCLGKVINFLYSTRG